MSPPTSWSKNKSSMKAKLWLSPAFVLISCSVYSSTPKWSHHDTPKRPLTFNGLHGVMSKKTELFITTAVGTSNPTCYWLLTPISSLGFCPTSRALCFRLYYSVQLVDISHRDYCNLLTLYERMGRAGNSPSSHSWVSDSNLGPETAYPDSSYLSLQTNSGTISYEAKTTSFLNHSNPLLTILI
jgi:hypothetical protein